MLRSSLFTVSAIALMAGAAAQNSPQTLKAEKVPGAIKHAGIYHVSTGTWTRTGGAVANFGPDTIYSNTAESGYFSSAGGAGGFAPGSINFDEGQVPSSTNPNNAGNRDEYNVNCILIGYCDLGAAGTGGWELGFYTNYQPCTLNAAPDALVATGALPANGCWTVSFDLSGGNEFCLGADGGNGFDNDQALDSFGWSYRYNGTDGSGAAGFLLASDPQSTDPNYATGGLPSDGTNTYYGPVSLCGAGVASGLTTDDFWWLEDPAGASSGCYFFGGYSNNNGCGGPSNPYASWYFELQADTGSCNQGPTDPCVSYCNSNPNSTGGLSTLTCAGSAVVANNDFTLNAAIPTNSFGFFITSQTAGFIMNPAGSAGNICVSGNIGRYQQNAASSGAAGLISLGTANGINLAAIRTAQGGPYAAAAGIRTHWQLWHRDSSPQGPTSNFTNGVYVDWQ
ncbi:hypothetical protein Poly30_30500 [Planctomycetes bacterium Poly30]|uniref:Uncharacterized protein n=1 Tax=Saltatorellus ferox TaxID=2528018 RepID=A0A518ETV9_9BACT|nr:hypothetical protein Poly30_30500 [Planctomycetes bacterium Poly30]